MAILVDENTQLIVHGITGREGLFHSRIMIDSGTKVVAGVVPGKGGQRMDGIPVFNTAKEAVDETGGNTSVIFVPKQFALSAVSDALNAQVPLIICLAEGVPVHDVLKMKNQQKKGTSTLIGPNTAGVISPGEAKVGIMPHRIYTPGVIGVVSRSGTLSYETVNLLSRNGIGQSTCVGIGGDMIPCFTFVDALKLFEKDDGTEAIIIIGEVGGVSEIEAAKYIKNTMNKPVFAVIAGINAPPGKKMGHAGAIITGERTTAATKMNALKDAGVLAIENIFDLPEFVLTKMASEFKAV